MRILNRKQTFFASLGVVIAGAVLLCVASAMTQDNVLVFTQKTESKLSSEELAAAIENPAYWPTWFKRLHRARLIDLTGRDVAMNSQVIEVGSLIKLQFEPKRDTPFSEDPIFYTGSKPKIPLDSELSTLEVQVRSLAKGHFIEFALDHDASEKISSKYRELSWRVSLEKQESGQIEVKTQVTAIPIEFKSKLLGVLFRGLSLSPLAFQDARKLSETKLPLSHLQLKDQFQR
jgi:hypothetical protein